jgi:hypothetical protein
MELMESFIATNAIKREWKVVDKEEALTEAAVIRPLIINGKKTALSCFFVPKREVCLKYSKDFLRCLLIEQFIIALWLSVFEQKSDIWFKSIIRFVKAANQAEKIALSVSAV